MRIMTRIIIPTDVFSMLSILNKNGFESYAVGGCVRDSLLGKVPHDWDICTNAVPDEVKNVFADYDIIETGLKHGTLTVKGEDDFYEITTFRIDGDYSDGRHPDNINFVKSLSEDLARRDFTVNAMAADKEGNIIDYNNGIKNLNQKLIRCVGNPDERFKEDSLRILRALRFAARYNFRIENQTKEAIHRNKKLLENVSQERITSEFRQIIRFANKEILMEFSDVVETIIPEIGNCIGFNQNNPHHIYNVYEHIATAVDFAIFNESIRLALLFHDIGKPKTYIEDDRGIGHFPRHAIIGSEMTQNILERMRFDKKTTEEVVTLVKYHDLVISATPSFARRMLGKLGEEHLFNLMEVMRCDKMAQSDNPDREKTLSDICDFNGNIEMVLGEQDCFSVKDLVVNGNDLKKIGIPEGPNIGKVLKELLDCVIEYPDQNKKEVLLEKAKNIKLP